MLQYALKAVLPHVSKESDILNAVHVRPGECVATDRYSVAWSKFDGYEGEPFLLPTQMAKDVAKMKGNLTLSYDSGTRSLTVTSVLGETRTFILPDLGVFPAVDRLLPGDDTEPIPVTSLNFGALQWSKFRHTHIARGNEKWSGIVVTPYFTGTEERPGCIYKIEFSDHFTALVQGMRDPRK